MPARAPQILVVDDRPENRYVICRVLRQAGYDCSEVGTGTEALRMAKSLPDLIILDVRLPDYSGYEVCQKIKQDPLTSQIAILQISASFVSSEDRARALEAGADGYLTHPIDGIVLVATARALLRLRAAEGIARKSAEQWQATFDALSEGVALVDADGYLARWNGAFAEICGRKFDANSGADAAALLENVLGSSQGLRSSAATPYRAEYAIDQRTVQLVVNPVNPNNLELGRVLVLSDLTDRKLAEYALRTAEKISATGKLAHAIAHEINNPLEALTNLLYLAHHSQSLDDIHDLVGHATNELDRIARITKQTLSFQRDTQSPLVVDVGELVAEVVALYQKSSAARRVRVVCHRQPTFAISGFPGQLNQVINNLVRNAAEAAPENTEVVVRVRSIRRKGREGTRVTIHDCGSGIPLDVQSKMFDPFFTTKELKGSGLGLWVSKNLVIKHSGTIRFRTCARPGRTGTTFEVYLPAEGTLAETQISEPADSQFVESEPALHDHASDS